MSRRSWEVEERLIGVDWTSGDEDVYRVGSGKNVYGVGVEKGRLYDLETGEGFPRLVAVANEEREMIEMAGRVGFVVLAVVAACGPAGAKESGLGSGGGGGLSTPEVRVATFTPVIAPPPATDAMPVEASATLQTCVLDRDDLFAVKGPNGGALVPGENIIASLDSPLKWDEKEKSNIVGVDGQPVWPGLMAIGESEWAVGNRLDSVGAWAAVGCGVRQIFRDEVGRLVWATVVDPLTGQEVVSGLPDGNGVGTGVDEIPNLGAPGEPYLVIDKDGVVLAWKSGIELGWLYDEVRKVWMPFVPFTETPVPSDTSTSTVTPTETPISTRVPPTRIFWTPTPIPPIDTPIPVVSEIPGLPDCDHTGDRGECMVIVYVPPGGQIYSHGMLWATEGYCGYINKDLLGEVSPDNYIRVPGCPWPRP